MINPFAFRKGHTYGTMVCDHQSGVPLTLLPDRLPETIIAWLQNHPFVQVVSRDGFTAFRQAITHANSSIKQVYDRWHFIRNAKKQVDTYLSSLVPSSIILTDSTVEETTIPLTAQERATAERQEKKWLLIQEIQQEYKSGKNIADLSKQYQLDRFTYSYSNGLLEGQINRLKAIKRITYGRAGLKLLEKRVLYRFD